MAGGHEGAVNSIIENANRIVEQVKRLAKERQNRAHELLGKEKREKKNLG